MNQNEKQSSNPNVNSSALTQFRVNTYKAMPVPLNAGERAAEDWDIMDIRAVGVGPLGIRMAQLLARNLAGINCSEVIRGEQETSGDMAALLSCVQSSDLVFLLSGFDDECCESVAQTVGHASCGAGVLTLVVTPTTDIVQCNDGQEKWYDTMFIVSENSLPSNEEPVHTPETVISFSMQQLLAAITNLITHRTCIGIDFNDVIRVMHEGSSGKMGIGIATGSDNASIAAKRAIEHLRTQGEDMSTALGVLAVVHGSSELTMDDFDSASMVIHEHISSDANILVGLDEGHLGDSVMVTILTAH